MSLRNKLWRIAGLKATGAELDITATTLKRSGTEITATADELNQNDLSVIGAAVKVKKISVTRAASTSAQDSTFDLPTKGAVLDVFVHVKTAEVTGTTKTLDVGLLAGESGGDEDGFIDGISVSTTGLKKGNGVATTGSNNTYLGAAATHTIGALMTGLLITGEDTAAGGDGVLIPRPHMLNGTAKSVTYTFGSNNFAELVADIYIVYLEIN